MDPRDEETARWVGQVMAAGGKNGRTSHLPSSALTANQVTATSAAVLASEARPTSRSPAVRDAKRETSSDVLAPPIIGDSVRPASKVTTTVRASGKSFDF